MRSAGRAALLAAGLLALVPLPAGAQFQQEDRLPRVGYLSHEHQATARTVDEFRRALRARGYVDGQNLVIEWRFAGESLDRLEALAGDLVALGVDIIFADGNRATRAAGRTARTTPLVTVTRWDRVAGGPEGARRDNLTGVTSTTSLLVARRLELVKAIRPRASRVALVWSPADPLHPDQLWEIERVGGSLGIRVQSVSAASAAELGEALGIRGQRADALIVLDDGYPAAAWPWLVDVPARRRVPAIYGRRDLVRMGGLLSYGAGDEYTRAARQIDRILKGARPAELPVETPTHFDLAVNLETARGLGLSLPRSVVAGAAEVIE